MNTENEVAVSAVAEETKVTKPAKKAAPKKKSKPAKKAAPVKKITAPTKYTLKEPVLIKAGSIAEAVKLFKQSKERRAILKVNGKTFAATLRNTWSISKNLLQLGPDGLVMVIDGEGYYIYPKAKYTEVFGAIMKSATWKEKGVYSQSGLPAWHEEFFTAK